MTSVLIKHRVKDALAWKKIFDSHADFRKKGGEMDTKIFQAAEDPNELVLLFDWDSIAKAKNFMDSPELKSLMAEAGVMDKPRIHFLNAM